MSDDTQERHLMNAITAAKEAGNAEMQAKLKRALYELARTKANPQVQAPNNPLVEGGRAPWRGDKKEVYPVRERLMVRMGWPKTANLPMRLHLDENAGKVFIFGIKDGEAFVLTDDANMFPSDQLVTQLRMITA